MHRNNGRKDGRTRTAFRRALNHHCQQDMSDRQFDIITERRTDLRTSLLIDAAINTAQSHKLLPIADELVEQGLEPNLVLRVLTMPNKRRCYVELFECSRSLLSH